MEFITEKTIKQINFDYILEKLNPVSSYGKKYKKKLKPFLPSMEKELMEELNKIEDTLKTRNRLDLISVIAHIKDLSETFERAKNDDILDVVEFFEIKNFIFQIEKLAKNLRGSSLIEYNDLQIVPINTLMKKLDPRNDKLKTFYIYDEYSEKLSNIRQEKKETESKIKIEKKQIKRNVKDKYDVKINLRNEILVNKNNEELILQIKKDNLLVMSGENYLNLIYTIRNTQEIDLLENKLEKIKIEEEEEELEVRRILTNAVKEEYENIVKNIKAISKIDILLAKAIYAERTNSVKPIITTKHILKIEEGRHLKVENMVKKSGKDYIPITIDLENRVTCITGANMGGKTVALKMIAQIAAAAQYGLYVPCKYAEIGLSDFIYISTGDSQSIEEGLSTFGAEIFGLKEILENTKHKGLVLIDELARGTNPSEGYAITKAVINYLTKEQSISVITTHYDNTASDKSIQKLQVAGLKNIDNEKIKDQLLSSPNKGMEIVSQYMDYRLIKVQNTKQVPKDAIRIAKLMGLNEQIIEEAVRLLIKDKNTIDS